LGRLLPFTFSLLTIFFLYLILKKRATPTGMLLSLLICALSISSIINAKISHTYTIGCLAAAILLFLIQSSRQENFFQKHWLGSGLVTALSAYAHYHLLFLLPAYYLAAFFFKYKNPAELKKLIQSGFVNFILCLPVLVNLLFFNSSNSTTVYSIGKHQEFLFNPVGMGIAQTFIYTISFFLKNSFIVVTHTLSPVTADKAVFWLCGAFFCALLLSGLKKSFKQPEGLFCLLSLATYFILVSVRILALTPTRQSLVYLPIFVYLISQGAGLIQKKYLLSGLIIIYLGIFLRYFPGFVQERRDPINEPELTQIIEQYSPSLIAGYHNTMHGALFKTIRAKYNYIDTDHNIFVNRPTADYKTVAFISTWGTELDAEHFAKAQYYWNSQNSQARPWQTPYARYKIIYQKIITSNIEHEPNYWNTNGTNNLFFYILAAE
jgi:hypothetical protein